MCFARRIHFCCWRRQAPRILVQAEILDVDIAPEAGVEEQVPAGVMIVVVDIYFSYVLVAAVRISPPRLDTVVFGIPIRMGIVRVVPALVFPVVVAVAVVAAIFVLVLAFMLPVIMVIVAVLRRSGDGQRSGQGHE